MADQNDVDYEHIEYVDYKDTEFLEQFINNQGKILPRRVTDVPARVQRQITTAIKRARHLALLPYVSESIR
jgi:small subunit ribosomal protein S18